jgi:hypothetical protein
LASAIIGAELSAELLVELVLEAEAIEQLKFLDVREGGLGVSRDAIFGHREGETVLTEQDMEACELGENRVAGGSLEFGSLSFK